MGISQGQEGQGETNGEKSMEAYKLPYVKQVVNGNLPCDSENSNQGSVTVQSGGKG